MIQLVKGDILEDDADAIVVPVNTVGVMGKGLALQVTKEWPFVLSVYQLMLQTGVLAIGRVYTVMYCPRLILFPTKAHWRDPSRLEYIRAGLASMTAEITAQGLRSVAVPALGCGLGGLDWNIIRPLIEAALGHLPTNIRLYAPKEGG